MKKFLVLYFGLLLILTTCEPPTKSDDNKLTITTEYKSTTRIDLALDYSVFEEPVLLDISFGDSTYGPFSVFSTDTVFVFTNLKPNTTYTWNITLSATDGYSEKKNYSESTDTPLSRNFTWLADTLGHAQGSLLYDVKIIAEDHIWAVGEFWKERYSNVDKWNAAVWNGMKWELLQVSSKQTESDNAELVNVIYALEYHNDIIWASVGGIMLFQIDPETKKATNHYYGPNHALNDQSITEIRCYQSKVFFRGKNGLFGYFENGHWEIIDLQTGLDVPSIEIIDDYVWISIYDLRNGITEPFIKRYNIKENRMEDVTVPNQQLEYNAIFYDGENIYLNGQDGYLFRSVYPYDQFEAVVDQPPFQQTAYVHKIKGSSFKNVFVIGNRGVLWHYNGGNWLVFENIDIGYIPFSECSFNEMHAKANIVAIGGVWTRTDAPRSVVILIGKLQ